VCAAHQDPLDARRPTGMPLRLTAADPSGKAFSAPRRPRQQERVR